VPLHFNIEGNAAIIATGNANPSDMESMQQPQHKTFQGRCLVLVRPDGRSGKATLNATGDGLTPGQVFITVR
jgi:beta-galactosidase